MSTNTGYRDRPVRELLPERLRVEMELPAGVRITPAVVDGYVALVASRARWLLSQRYQQALRERVAEVVAERVAKRKAVPK